MKSAPRLLLAGLLLAPYAPMAADQAPVDEVVVEATRATLVKLAKEVRLAEVRFYERYNQLNTVRDYAVNCSEEATTGTRFTLGYCRPVFQSKSTGTEGQSFAQIVGQVGATGTPSAPASMTIAAARPGFQKNMIEVTRKNPDLTQLLNEYGERLKQYEDVYRKVNGAPPPGDPKH